jgi:serine/threonine protein kinase
MLLGALPGHRGACGNSLGASLIRLKDLRDLQAWMIVLKKLGKYELLEEVGRGAMGQVYKAYDPALRRLRAVKTIKASFVGEAELLERFYQEARSAARLDHPNIVIVHELEEKGDPPYIAMEFIEGESLEKLIQRRPVLSLSYKAGLVLQVCKALDYAHRQGIVHRDIKPANVMLTKGDVVKVVDFGIARVVETSVTQSSMMIGTMGYMSPQQLNLERADQRSDIWALGVTFYELVCYARPFQGADQYELKANIVDPAVFPPPLNGFVQGCPFELAAVVAKMLQKDVSRRFQTMEEVLFEMERLCRTLDEASVPGLIEGAEAFVQAGDLANARKLVRKVLEVDSRNEKAHKLWTYINSDERRSQIQPELQSRVTKGRKLLKEGRHREAKVEARAALALDSNYAPALELLAKSELAGKIVDSKAVIEQRLNEGALTEAGRRFQDLSALDPDDPQVVALGKQIQDAITRRSGLRRRVAEILKRDDTLRIEGQVDDRIEFLANAQKEFSDDSEIARRLEEVRRDRQQMYRNGAGPKLDSGEKISSQIDWAAPLPTRSPGFRSTRWVIALMIMAILSGLGYLIFHAVSSSDAARLARAQELEDQKRWPEALLRYEELASRPGTVSGDAQLRANKLRTRLDDENSLFKKAQDEEGREAWAKATQLYKQAAALGGDREQEALDKAENLSGKLEATRHLPEAPKPTPPELAPVPPKPKTTVQPGKCELALDEVQITLETANKSYHDGNYAEAARKYREVLNCDRTNIQAQDGLQRIQAALSN